MVAVAKAVLETVRGGIEKVVCRPDWAVLPFDGGTRKAEGSYTDASRWRWKDELTHGQVDRLTES